MKKLFFFIIFIFISASCYCWGFFGHRIINQHAVFLLPPEMLAFYKPNMSYIYEHAVDADKRRYAVAGEGSKHYIDIDVYGKYPFVELPRMYEQATAKYGEDSIMEFGTAPWAVQDTYNKLISAFRRKNFSQILRHSSDLGHYVADAHVPLHASNNYNGQLSDQKGIHGLWESRVPELMAEKEFDFFIGKAGFIKNIEEFIWNRILESAVQADTVLNIEKELSKKYSDNKYAFEERNGKYIRQYSSVFTREYNALLNNMVERRMRQSIYAVASFWYTAWINAGQPELKDINNQKITNEDLEEFEELNKSWRSGKIAAGREHGD